MSNPLSLVFPNNIVETLVTYLAPVTVTTPTGAFGFDPAAVLRRPLRVGDPASSLGIFATDWLPVDLEIGDPGPAVSRYQVMIQVLTKNTDQQEGRSVNGALGKAVRGVIYRSTSLRLALAALSEIAADGSKERFQRHGVTRQRYASNDLQGQWLHLTTLDLWVETEVGAVA